MVATRSGALLLGTDVGVFKSTVNDSTFNLKDTLLPRKLIYHLVTDSSGIIYGMSFDSVFRSVDNGTTWKLVNTRIWRGQAFSDIAATPTGRVFLAAWNELYTSVDGISNWISIRTPVSGLSGQNQPQLAVIDDSTLFLSGDATYYTKDRGLHWTACDTLNSACPRVITFRGGYVAVATASTGVATTAKPFGAALVQFHTTLRTTSQSYTAYPNPSTGQIRIFPNPRQAHCKVYDELGVLVGERPVSAAGEVDLGDVGSGAYMIEVGGSTTPVLLIR